MTALQFLSKWLDHFAPGAIRTIAELNTSLRDMTVESFSKSDEAKGFKALSRQPAKWKVRALKKLLEQKKEKRTETYVHDKVAAAVAMIELAVERDDLSPELRQRLQRSLRAKTRRKR